MTEIIIKPDKYKFSNDGYEEIEGRFFEKFGRLPGAEEAMTFYAIEVRECPLCGESFKNWDGEITKHMIEHFMYMMDESLESSRLNLIDNAITKERTGLFAGPKKK